MTFDLQSAKATLESITTIDGLRNLVRNTSATVEGASAGVTSLLYAGSVCGNKSFSYQAVGA